MGKLILEDRAHGNDYKEQKNHHCMDSLEEKVSVFVEDFENIHSDEDSGDDYGSENSSNNDLHGYHNERILFWEAQEALLQVLLLPFFLTPLISFILFILHNISFIIFQRK